MPLPTTNDIQEEIDRLIAAGNNYRTDSPEPTTSGEKRPSPSNNGDNDSAAEDNEANPGNETQVDINNQTPSEQQLFIKRISKRLKLNNAQVIAVEKFSKEAVSTQLTVLYSEIISLTGNVNKLAEDVGTAAFQITTEIHDNIKRMVKQTFFTPTVKDYKTEDTIKLLVMNRIRQSHIGIPKDLEEVNPQAWSQIESKVAHEVTQLRGAIKKVLKKDSTLEPGKQMKITALTKAVVGKKGTESEQFGVETVMRVALFRKVYSEHPGDAFWNMVDEWLACMRKGGTIAYESAMTGLVASDRKQYGVNVVDAVVQ